MSKKVKKFLALTIILSLVFAVAACGSGNKGSTTQSPAPATAATAAPATETPATATTAPSKPPITLKIYAIPTAVTSPSGVQTDPVAKEIEKLTGVTMDITFNGDDQKTQVMLASGDLPDLMMLDKKYAKQLIESGNIIPLDQLVDSNGPAIQKNWKDMVDFSKKNFSNGTNKLYFLSGSMSTGKPLIGFAPFVRWDYYKQLGYPEVKTTDDLAKVLIDLVKKQPKTADGKSVYAMGLHTDWGGLAYITPTLEMMGKQEWSMLDLKDQHSIPYSDKQYPYYQGARFLYLLNKAGVLDPDSFTQKYDAWSKKANEGRYAMIQAGWIAASANAAIGSKGDTNAGYMPILPNVPAFTTSAGPMALGDGGHLWAISKNAKDPKRAMEFLNFLFNPETAFIIHNGPEGLNWTNQNGVKVFTQDFLDKKNKDPNWRETTGANKYYHLAGMGGFYNVDGQYLDLTQDDKATPATAFAGYKKDWLSHFGVATEEEAIKKQYQTYSSDGTPGLLMNPQPDDIKRIGDKINTLLINGSAKAILAKSDAEFNSAIDKLIADQKAAGADKLEEWTKAENARVSALLGK